MSKHANTWVYVKLTFHSLGDALQLDGLQGAVWVDGGGGEAAQRFPDESGHLPHSEDLQKLAINGGEGPQEDRLGTSELRSITMGRRMERKILRLDSTVLNYACAVLVCGHSESVCVCVCAPRCHRLTGISVSRGYCCDENAD